MMLEFYEDLFSSYKEYMEENSQYIDKNSEYKQILKFSTKTASHFPIVTFNFSNCIDTDNDTIDKIEQFDEYYFTIDIYTKDKIIDKSTIASQIINNELTELTIKFFDSLNMKRSSCRPIFNIDDSILRTNIQYQCMRSTRGNIIRR